MTTYPNVIFQHGQAYLAETVEWRETDFLRADNVVLAQPHAGSYVPIIGYTAANSKPAKFLFMSFQGDFALAELKTPAVLDI